MNITHLLSKNSPKLIYKHVIAYTDKLGNRVLETEEFTSIVKAIVRAKRLFGKGMTKVFVDTMQMEKGEEGSWDLVNYKEITKE